MAQDEVRIKRLTELMRRDNIDALVCMLPHNVLMLSGYYPVLGQSIAVLLPDGHGTLIVPESELHFAHDGWFDDIRTFKSATLDYVISPAFAADPLFAEVCCQNGISDSVLGIEISTSSATMPYLEVQVTGASTHHRWSEMLPGADFRDATDLLEEAAMIKSPIEIERIVIASTIAEFGFEAAREFIGTGIREIEVAMAAKTAMELRGTGWANVKRVGVWAFCQSGQRSADAYYPYQHSTNRLLQTGDPVIVHINCHADGFWTDMTRTFFTGDPSKDQKDAYKAVIEAQANAITACNPGTHASEVDNAARSTLAKHGLDDKFIHGTGHGVGFRAIGHGIPPMIHPKSEDILQVDMVFNIEPAVYIPEQWGIRVCDVVSIRSDGSKVLSGMQRDFDWAVCDAM